MNAREAAVLAVMDVTDKKKSIHIVVSEMLGNMADCDSRERALAKRITEGTVERLYGIDYVLNCFSKTKTDKMKPFIRALLRISAYQLLFMDGIPASAACNEAVKYAKKHGLEGLSGFVNGVLRTVSREGRSKLEKTYELAGREGQVIKYSTPAWLLDQWEEDYGKQTMETIASAQFDARPVFFRVNLSKCSVEECIEALAKEGINCFVPDFELPKECDEIKLNIIEAVNCEGFASTEAFKKGLFMVQDISSVIVGDITGLKGGEHILDLCAAPGGKTMHFADILSKKGKGGFVEARDLTEKKISLIKENLNRTGFDNVRLRVADASVKRPEDTEKFDVVLADVPCSGTGVTGRKPDIKYNMSIAVQEELAELQKPILENAVNALKKGGTLIFSTCTLNRKENCSGMELLESLGLKKENELTVLPGIHTGDGFFISKFTK